MSPGTPINDRPLASDDRALRPGWDLLEFLASIGADEFAVRFMYAGDDGREACDRLVRGLAFALLGERMREGTVTYASESNPRSVEVWRFDAGALEALRAMMPDGVLGSSGRKDAWPEDLCVYRRGELLFGTVTHEQYAFIRLTDAEWRQWEAQSAAARDVTIVNAPPPMLDGARVLWWAWSGDTPFGELYGAGEDERWVHGFAVCQYDSGQIYRFTCNKCWEVVQDMDHSTEEEAKASIPANYDADRVRWQRYSPPTGTPT